jgi:hypothetical protein
MIVLEKREEMHVDLQISPKATHIGAASLQIC